MKLPRGVSMTLKAIAEAARAAADATSRARDAVLSRETLISDKVQGFTTNVGQSTAEAGKALTNKAAQVKDTLHDSAAEWGRTAQQTVEAASRAAGGKGEGVVATALGKTVEVATHVLGLVAGGGVLLGKAAVGAGNLTEIAAPAAAGSVSGMARGGVDIVSGTIDAAVLSESDIEALRNRLVVLGTQRQEESKTFFKRLRTAQLKGNRKDLLDMLVVGGISLSQAAQNPGLVSAKVTEAFSKQYPNLAAQHSFGEVVQNLSTGQLAGFASGVKGKLFELELVDHLNRDMLSDGSHAELASSSTQTGWDIAINDGQGHTLDLLQAKATDSVSYVKEALSRYPDIDVMTTSEVYADLLARGLAEHVQSSGISDALLEAKVNAALAPNDASQAQSLLPSSVGLAVIALSVFVGRKGSLRESASEFGQRGTKATATGMAGKAALAATQTWWIALIVGVGSRWVIKHGNDKRDQYDALRRAIEAVESKDRRAVGVRALSPSSI